MPVEKQGLKADLHMHSHFSPDSGMSPGEIVNTAEKLGLDVIAVTDHNTVRGGLETEKMAKNKDLIVIVGSEIMTKDGEIIGLDVKRDIPKKLPLSEACRLIKEQGGLVLVPHPFERLRKGIGSRIKEIIGYIDAVEVFNARSYFSRSNERAFEFAKKHGLAMFACSDAHFAMEIGSAYTVIDSERKKESVIKAIKEGKSIIVGKRTGIKPHWKTFVKNVRRIVSLG
jgi:predicted metal-dependent phosphoesterase TrpH